MLTALISFHVVICILLIVVVLLQFGKGAEAGAMMGSGGSQAVFTSASKGNFFTKMTTFLAVAFMVNSIALSTIKSNSAKTSIFDGDVDAAPVSIADPTDEGEKAKAEGKVEKKAAPKKTETKK